MTWDRVQSMRDKMHFAGPDRLHLFALDMVLSHCPDVAIADSVAWQAVDDRALPSQHQRAQPTDCRPNVGQVWRVVVACQIPTKIQNKMLIMFLCLVVCGLFNYF